MARKPRAPRSRDITVESAAKLMLEDPDMGLEGALQAHGLTITDVSRAEREAIVTQVITEGFMTDDVRREYVKGARNLALTKAIKDGNMDQVKEWSDAIAAEPGVGLTQKQGAEVTLNIDNLQDAIRAALDTPPPINITAVEKEPHAIPSPQTDPEPASHTPE